MLVSGFPGGSEVKVSACNVGDPGSIPESGRSPGEGNGNPLQYSCLGNPTDGGAWWATVHGVAKSRTRLSDFTFLFNVSFRCCYCCSVTQLCLLYGLQHARPLWPHHLLKFAQVHVHCISDAIQPSHPLMLSSPSALNLFQHQGLFQ